MASTYYLVYVIWNLVMFVVLIAFVFVVFAFLLKEKKLQQDFCLRRIVVVPKDHKLDDIYSIIQNYD